MNRPVPLPTRPRLLLAATVLALCAGVASAQSGSRLGGGTNRAGASAGGAVGVTPGTRSATAPIAALPGTGTATPPAGAPSPSGLPSPLPFPGGIPSTVIAAPGTSAAGSGTGPTMGLPGSATAGTLPTLGTLPGNAPGTAASAGTPTATLPGGAAASTDLRTRAASIAGDTGVNDTAVMGGVGAATLGAAYAGGPMTALQVIQSFQQADINQDGLVSRAEAQRLPLPEIFEELDRNKDGALSRGEYEDSFRR